MRFRILAVLLTAVGLVLAACGTDDGSSEDGGEMDHAEMDHSSTGEVPDDLSRAENPEYPVDSQELINAEHMKGMDGAEATVTGAFDTTAYSVTYTPTPGGEPVENNTWLSPEGSAE